MTEQPVFMLQLTVRGCSGDAVLNGCLLSDLKAPVGNSLLQPMNHLLRKGKNELSFELRPLPKDDRLSTPDEISIEGSVRKYEEGEIATPEGGDIVQKLRFFEPDTDMLELSFPIERGFTFDARPPFDFTPLLTDSPKIEDKKTLLDYAMHIQELLKAEDIAGLREEFSRKMEDFAEANHEDLEEMMDEFTAYFEEKVLPARPVTDFERSELWLEPWCGGRIWKIGIEPDLPLIHTQETEKGTYYEIPVFVARPNGEELKIVR